jgi:hypothetical protein
MLTILSALDERARPKGSRDPLGIEAIWSHTGRQLVGNLTTVTGNLENFIVALLCCRYANESAMELEEIQQRYMRAEQLAAYLKLACSLGGLQGFLGITKAKKHFQKSRIPLGASESAQILSDQLSYGLWGLYSSALDGSGLISGAKRELTASGTELVDAIIGALGAGNWELYKDLASRTSIDETSLEGLAPAFASMLQNTALRHTVVEALLGKQSDCALQLQLYSLAKIYLRERGAEDAKQFCAWVLAREDASADIKQAFGRMRDLEPLLVIAETVMAWLQFERNTSEASLDLKLSPCLLHVRCADSWAHDAGLPYRSFLQTLVDAVNRGSANGIINAIVVQNKEVMQQRGGAPWIEFDHQRQLTVRVRNDKPSLPSDMAMHCAGWSNSYFLGSFLTITKQGMA